MQECRYDHVGYWSEIKIDIIKDYAAQYSAILTKQESPKFFHCYIDAFAGAGKHISVGTGEIISGSPTNALHIKPKFKAYHFIDINHSKIKSLEDIAEGRKDVNIYHGDCNDILLKQILPFVRWDEYKRGLCVLDPYGLHLNWEVIHTIGKMKSIEIFLNFPVCDMNRNVLWRKPEKVPERQIERMNSFWGDTSWKNIAYAEPSQMRLFGDDDEKEKATNDHIAAAFQERLKAVAGFKYVPDPIAMRNTNNAIVYYLFFASHRPVAEKIVSHIFNKYKDRRC